MECRGASSNMEGAESKKRVNRLQDIVGMLGLRKSNRTGLIQVNQTGSV